MNSLKKHFLIGLVAISCIATNNSTMEITDTTFSQEVAKELVKMFRQGQISSEEISKILKPSQISTETMAGNFSQAAPELINALHDCGMGVSRFALNSSLAIRDLAQFFAKHYILFGAFIASSAYFWWYIWPNITVRVHYNSDHRPAPAGR